MQTTKTPAGRTMDVEAEERRLAALRSYRVLDSDPEPQFDIITAHAADMFDAPICLMSLVDRDRLWFKSTYGLGASELTRDLAFCVVAIEDDDVLVVPDAARDSRFADSVVVRGPPHVRTYVGAPLITPHGYRIGTLALIYDQVTPVPFKTRARLRQLAALVVHELEVSRQQQEDRKARIEAIAANQSKSMFLGSMSDEIRGQMKRLLDGARTLQRSDLSPQQKELAITVERAAGAIATIITGSIDYARIEAGWLDPRVTVFVVEELVDSVARAAAPQARVKGLRFDARVAASARGPYLADESRIRQVLESLISGAIEDTAQGEVVVAVETATIAASGFGFTELVFTVRDTGAGKGPEELETIFSPLAQGRAPIVREDGGVLLGLPTCRRLCEHLGGWIDVESELGVGTVFRFGIPAEVGDRPE